MSAQYQQPTPPAPPAIQTLPILNTTIVSKSGNDATGIVNRFDKPFLTFTAALNAVAAYYDGISHPIPSATNPVGIIGYPGYYNENIELQDYVNIYADGCTIECTSGALATIDDNNNPVNVEVRFYEIINSSGSANCIRIRNAGSTVHITTTLLVASQGYNIYADNGELFVDAKFILNFFNNGIGVYNISGNVTVNSSFLEVGGSSGRVFIHGSGGDTTINSNCFSASPNGDIGDSSGSGNVTINGNCICSNSGNSALGLLGSGNITITGNVQSPGPYLNIAGSGIFTLYGDFKGSSASGTIIDLTAGTVFIYGNIDLGGFIGSANDGATGQLTIFGNITNTSDTPIQLDVNSTMVVICNSSVITAANPLNNTGTTNTMILNNCRIVQPANIDGLDVPSGTTIVNNCTIIVSGTGKDSSAASVVKLYGVSQTPDLVGAGATYQVGALIRDANVV